MLADAARQFSYSEHTAARRRACRERTPDFDRSVWQSIAGLGWLGVLVPEDRGGLGAGFGDMGQLVYAWGRACAPEPLVASGVLAARSLVHADGPACQGLIDSLVAGTLVPALAAHAGDTLAHEAPGVHASPDGADWNLGGQARYAVPADADGFIVAATSDTGTQLFWVPSNAAGLAIRRERRADGSFAACLTLANVSVGAADVVASAKSADSVVARATDEALVLVAVEMAGMMRAMLDLTLEYLRTRVQFGKPIGSFQALQHRTVDLYLAEQLARDVAQAACGALDTGTDGDERALLASRTKARACESLNRIAREAVQLHGAIGFTDEYALGTYVNRALVLSAWLGNANAHRARYARIAPPLEVLSA
jgi:alkylation response protein AidB-like acyl-CoA dehydrogenase